MTHSKAPYTTNKVRYRTHILPKYSINSTTSKWIHFYLFRSENVRKVSKMSYFMQFKPILGPYYPLKSPLHYQQSTLQGSYSPKILHKIVLPENGFISIFSEVKMFEKCQKCHICLLYTSPSPRDFG